MPALSSPDELQQGERYRILGGYGQGEIGICVGVRSTEFGHFWGEIRTGTGSYWTRWQELELVPDDL